MILLIRLRIKDEISEEAYSKQMKEKWEKEIKENYQKETVRYQDIQFNG